MVANTETRDQLAGVATGLQLFFYYVLGRPVISDREYDKLEKSATDLSPESPVLRPGSDREEDYCKQSVRLAMELWIDHEARSRKN